MQSGSERHQLLPVNTTLHQQENEKERLARTSIGSNWRVADERQGRKRRGTAEARSVASGDEKRNDTRTEGTVLGNGGTRGGWTIRGMVHSW